MNNLIGINGPIRGGKDFVGHVFQYLALPDYWSKENKNIIADSEFDFYATKNHSDFEIRKFADPLKDTVCIILKCSREDLEDREFKETPLGPEWKRWTVATPYLFQVFESEKQAQAFLNNLKANRYDEWEDSILTEEELTPRLIMQYLGAEGGRERVHPSIWINSLFNEWEPDSKWIITDVRKKNEAQIIKDKGGVLIQIKRDYIPLKGDRVFYKNKLSPVSINEVISSTQVRIEQISNVFIPVSDITPVWEKHQSEQELKNWSGFDFTVDNNSSLDHLINQIKKIWNSI